MGETCFLLPFYCCIFTAYLDCLLGTLMHLTSSFSWSKCKGGMTPKEPLPQLISGLCELVQTFHCGKGTAAAMSLMGLSIAKNIMLILNHLVAEMQHCKTKVSNSLLVCFVLHGSWKSVFVTLERL